MAELQLTATGAAFTKKKKPRKNRGKQDSESAGEDGDDGNNNNNNNNKQVTIRTSSSDQQLNLALARVQPGDNGGRKNGSKISRTLTPATIKEEASSPPADCLDDFDQVAEGLAESLDAAAEEADQPPPLIHPRRPHSLMFNLGAADDDESSSSSPSRNRCELKGLLPDRSASLPIAISTEEITAVKRSFEDLKPDSREIGSATLRRVLEVIPETAKTWGLSLAPKDKASDSWRIMGQGLTFLNGIERLANRLDRPQRLRSSLKRLLSSHRERYHVPPDWLAITIGIFESVLMDFWKEKHQHNDDGQHNGGTVEDLLTTSSSGGTGAILFVASSSSSMANSASQASVNNENNSNNDSDSNDNSPDGRTAQQRCIICSGWEKFFNCISLLLQQIKIEDGF